MTHLENARAAVRRSYAELMECEQIERAAFEYRHPCLADASRVRIAAGEVFEATLRARRVADFYANHAR